MKNEIKNPMERYISNTEINLFGDGGVSDCNDCDETETENPYGDGGSGFICAECGQYCPCDVRCTDKNGREVCMFCYRNTPVPPDPEPEPNPEPNPEPDDSTPDTGFTGMFLCSHCGGEFSVNEQNYVDPENTVCNACYAKINSYFVCSKCGYSCPCSFESAEEGVCKNCYVPPEPDNTESPKDDPTDIPSGGTTDTPTDTEGTEPPENEDQYGDGGVSDCEGCDEIDPKDEPDPKPGHTGTFICSDCGGTFDQDEQHYIDPNTTVCNSCYVKYDRFICTECFLDCPCSYESSIEEVCINCYNALPNCPVCGVKVYAQNRFCDGYDYCKTCGNAITVTVTPSSATVEEGESVSLTATVSHGQDLPVTWSASGDKVSVSDDGTVTGISAGSATVTASIPLGASDSATVTVKPAPVQNTDFICEECKRSCPCRNRAYETDYCYECYRKFPICPKCLKKVTPEDRLCEGSDLCKECGEKLTIFIHPANAKVTVGKTVQLVAVISENYDLPVTWSTDDTDKISVSSDGTVTALSTGTATVTATIPGGAKATVTVEVDYDNSHVYVDYQKHHTFDCGRAGSGSVRLMDGKLSFVHHDATLTSKGMPLTISHSYDPSRVGTPVNCGDGWHLSLDQSLVQISDENDSYIYTDANGREHRLKKDKNDNITDIAGLGIIFKGITVREKDDDKLIPTSALRRVFDTKGNTMYFTKDGNLVGLRDSNGNQYTILFDENGKISEVYETLKSADGTEPSDEHGRTASFTYDSLGRLSEITNFDGEKISYHYSGVRLARITYPSETFANGDTNHLETHFGYDTNGRLSSIKDITGITTSIEYYDDDRVSGMTVSGTKTVSDQSVVESEPAITASDIGFDYGVNTASLTDRIKGTRIVYNLDSEGRELFAYEDSSILPIEERTEVTLSSVTGYTDKLDPNTKEKTTGRLVGASAYVTAAAAQATNLLTNSEFSSSSGWTVSENGTGSSGVVTEGLVTDKNSYRFISNEPTGENKLVQTITDFSNLDGNVFVASVWAKASGAINTISDDRVQFALKVIAYPAGDNAEQIEYRADFDPSKDGEWQYAAIPIGATPKYSKIEYVLDYSGNVGTCMFSDPMLIAIDGTEKYTYVDNGDPSSYDEWHFIIINEPKHIIKRVHVIEGTKTREEYYDDSHNLVKVVEHGDNSTEFVSLYKYDNHNLDCAKDKYGNIHYYKHDSFGRIEKMYTNPSDYSSHIRYTERVYEDGKYYPKSETDPRYKYYGNKLETSYVYDEDLGQLQKFTDTNGQEYNYQYDSDTGNLISLYATVIGRVYANDFRYTNGYLTSVSHNRFDYKFGYDELGRTSTVSVGGEQLLRKSYTIEQEEEYKDTETTEYETGESVSVVTDRRGNPTETAYKDSHGVEQTVSTTAYDALGRAIYVIDNLRNIKYNYNYNVDGSIDYVEQRDPATAELISTDTYTYVNAKRLISKTYGAVGHTYRPIYEHDGSERIYPDDNVIGVSLAGKFTDKIATDGLRRTATRTLTLANGTPLISDSYTYYTSVIEKENIPCTCDYVTDLTTTVYGNIASTLSYTYDRSGNIETVSKGDELLAEYHYDAINRLTREDNKAADKTYTWSYDLGGNITEKRTYAYTTGSLLNCDYTADSYTYAASGWKDQLTSFNGQSIIYDAIGNPTTYKGNNLTWTHVRRLASYGANTFEYGADGIRTKKNNISYLLDGNKILRETDGASRNITYYYGTNGVVGFNYNGTDYYYRKNLQGDIIAIYTSTGTLVAEYVYDAWGKVTTFDLSSENIGTLNPFRYRSYYYDTETNLYYLNSRYYDPETGRFINADDVQCLNFNSIYGLNVYLYNMDNPNFLQHGVVKQSSKNIIQKQSIGCVNSAEHNAYFGGIVDSIASILDSGSTIHGFYTSISAIANNANYFYYNISSFTDDMAILGSSVRRGVLAFNGFNWSMGTGDVFGLALGVALDIYDSKQRNTTTGGLILGAALTTVKSIGLIYLNKAIIQGTTAIGSLCGPIGSVVGFVVGSSICIFVDLFASEWIDCFIDGIAK